MTSSQQKDHSDTKIRVVLALPYYEGHDKGLTLVSRWLRDAGMEVIYLGSFVNEQMIVSAAIAEDADAIGLSFTCSRLYTKIFPRVVELLRERGADGILVIGGGHILDQDRSLLEKEGVIGNFGPGTPKAVIIDFITDRVKENRLAKCKGS